MLRRWRRDFTLSHRSIVLEQLEDRIVLDAAAGANCQDAQDLHDQQTDQQVSTDDAPEAAQAAGDPSDPHTEAADTVADIFNQSLTDVLITNATDQIEGLSDAYANEAAGGEHILVISSSVESADRLVEAAQPGVLTLVYDAANTDLGALLSQIEGALNGRDASSIAFVTHGAGAGRFDLTGDHTVTLSALSGDSALQNFWEGVGGLLTEEGRIDILSCYVADGDEGSVLIDRLEKLTGHDVAGSNDLTGNPADGGDWTLESDGVDLCAVYFVADKLESLSGTLPVEEPPDNVAPVAHNDTYSVEEDTTLTVPALGVLDNDSDANGDWLSAELRTDVSHGTLTFNYDGSFTYTPDSNWNGTDTFTYIATDCWKDSAEATVTITVSAVNDAPTAIDLSANEVQEHQPVGTVVGILSSVDPEAGDTHTYSLVSGDGDAGNSSFLIDGNELKTVSSFDFETQDSYSIRIRSDDGHGGTYDQEFVIQVQDLTGDPVNTVNELGPVNEDNDHNGLVDLGGAFSVQDPDAGDDLTVTLHAGAGFDSLYLIWEGDQLSGAEIVIHSTDQTALNSALATLEAGLTPDFNGAAQVSITTSDGVYTTGPNTLDLTVNPVNDAPVVILKSGAGSPDPTFDLNGIVTTDVGSDNVYAGSVAVQADGKILVAGCAEYDTFDFVLVRYNANGTLDETFGNSGKVVTDIGSTDDWAYSVAIQSDGKILVAGRSADGSGNEDFALVRYNADGVLDTSFGSQGIVTTEVGSSWDRAYSVAIQSDGKILLAGVTIGGSGNDDFALVRYNANGALDTSFDNDGIVITDLGSYDQANSVAIQSDGKILLVGQTYYGHANCAVVRYNLDGSLDTTFDDDGIVTTNIGNDSSGIFGTVQSDGKILVTGYGKYGGYMELCLFRYNTDGSLDTGFDNDGIVHESLSDEDDGGSFVAVQSDGQIMVVGAAGTDFALVRFNSDGSLDTTFGSSGKVITEIDTSGGSSEDYCQSGVMQSDGKILAVGVSYNYTDYLFALVRYDASHLEYTAGEGARVVDDLLKLDDVDGQSVVSASITISGNYRPGEDILEIGDSALLGGVTKTWDEASGTLTLSGTASMADYQSMLRSVTYEYSSATPDTHPRTVSWTVNDGESDSTPQSSTISVRPVDDEPIANNDSYEIDEDNTLTIEAPGVLQNDAVYKGDQFVAVLKDDVSHGSLTLNGNGSFTYTPEPGWNGAETFTYVAYDGEEEGNEATVTITVNAVNSAPVLDLKAGAGLLDLTFDSDGVVTTDIGSSAEGYSVTIQSDGKILVAGIADNGVDDDFALVRYNPDGTLDTSFGVNGVVTTDIDSSDDCCQSMALQSDGKIVAAGIADNGVDHDFALVRYNPDGTLDTSFGANGVVTTDIGSSEEGYSVTIQSDGKILVAGIAHYGVDHDFALVRYNPDGTLDTSFGANGVVTTDIDSSDDYGQSMALQSDGKIVVAGYSSIGGNSDFTVVRYNSDGSLDTTFDMDGKVITDIDSLDDYGQSVAVQGDGKIVVAGYSSTGGNPDFTVVRYNSDGSLDTTFDSDGKVITDISSWLDYGRSVALQSDGKIVVAGYTFTGAYSDFTVVRYNSDGSLDTAFDSDGKIITDIGSSNNEGASVAVQGDGKIVVAGYANIGGSVDFAVVRYAESTLDYTEGDGALIINDALTLRDSDNVNMESATITITGGYHAGEDMLNIGDTDLADGVTKTWDEATGTLTLSGIASTADYQAMLRSVTYENTSENPNEAARFLVWTVNDGELDSPGQSSVVTVTGVNDVPVASDDTYAVDEDVTLTVPAAGVLGNDFDYEGDTLAAVLKNDVSHGSLELHSDGSFTYTPDSDWNGIDTFTYVAYDGQDEGNEATVTITVNPVNDSPVLTLKESSIGLDRTFDSDGIVTTDIGNGDEGYSVTIQSDGKILVAGSSDGDIALVRYNTDGSLDTSFGSNGIVTTDICREYDYGYSVALQSDGKILVAGYMDNTLSAEIALVRYNSDGSLDTSFGSDGKVLTRLSSSGDQGRSIAVQSDGKILVAGSSCGDIVLIRYNTDGSLDTSFDSDGIVTTDAGSYDEGYSVTIQSDGKIVVTGRSHDGAHYDIALVRYYADGSLDTSFDSDGIVTTDFGSDEVGYSVTVQSDGKIVVTGLSYNGTDCDIALVRYYADGSLDTSFDSDGIVTTDFGSDEVGYSVTVQSDGKIVVTGLSYNGTDCDIALVRYSADGSLDTSFGSDGMVSIDIGSSEDVGHSVAIQSDGKILVAGTSEGGAGDALVLLRYVESSLDYTEGDGARALDAFLTLTDADDNTECATIVISDNYQPGEDILNIADSDLLGGVTKTWDEATGTLTLSGSASTADYQAMLRSVTYENTSEDPSEAVRTLAWTVSDGESDSVPQDSRISVTAVNDAPAELNGGIPDKTLDEDSGDTVIDLRDFFQDAEDGTNLDFTVEGTWDANLFDSVSITGHILTLDYKADAYGADTITIRGTDHGQGGSSALHLDQAFSVTVNAVNDAPVVTSPGPQTMPEDSALVITGLSVADVDVNDTAEPENIIEVTVTVHHGQITLEDPSLVSFTVGDGLDDPTMTFTGTLAQVNAAMESITYSPFTDYHGSDSLDIVVSDLGHTGPGGPSVVESSIRIESNDTSVNDQEPYNDTSSHFYGEASDTGTLSTTSLTPALGNLLELLYEEGLTPFSASDILGEHGSEPSEALQFGTLLNQALFGVDHEVRVESWESLLSFVSDKITKEGETERWLALGDFLLKLHEWQLGKTQDQILLVFNADEIELAEWFHSVMALSDIESGSQGTLESGPNGLAEQSPGWQTVLFDMDRVSFADLLAQDLGGHYLTRSGEGGSEPGHRLSMIFDIEKISLMDIFAS